MGRVGGAREIEVDVSRIHGKSKYLPESTIVRIGRPFNHLARSVQCEPDEVNKRNDRCRIRVTIFLFEDV